MKYGFKVFRNEETNRIYVTEIMPVSWRFRLSPYGLALTNEYLRTFETEEEAQKAREEELLVADINNMPPEEQRKLYQDGMKILRSCLLAKVIPNAWRLSRPEQLPSPRVIARVVVASRKVPPIIEEMKKDFQYTLPGRGVGTMRLKKPKLPKGTPKPPWKQKRQKPKVS